MNKTKLGALILIVAIVGIGGVFFYNGYVKISTNHKAAQHPDLPIPAVLKDTNPDPNVAEYTLTAQQGKKAFISGKTTATYGYNGDYLGPVIRLKTGEKVNITVKNKLPEATTVHWHGLMSRVRLTAARMLPSSRAKHGKQSLR